MTASHAWSLRMRVSPTTQPRSCSCYKRYGTAQQSFAAVRSYVLAFFCVFPVSSLHLIDTATVQQCLLLACFNLRYSNSCAAADVQMQACGEPPADIVQEMSSAIAADLPLGAVAEGGNPAADMNFDGLDFGDVDLEALPQELKNCPVQ
jgi:hypothetical protein